MSASRPQADWQPPMYRDYLSSPEMAERAPEAPPDDGDDRSTIFVMLDDETLAAARNAEAGWEWDGPPPRKIWRASDQGSRGVLGEFEGTRDEAIAWARVQPGVKTIYVYSEEDQDIHPLDEP